MDSLLSEISRLYQKSKRESNQKAEHGDYFNIFNVIGLRSEEVRLHSAFIAELLNPKGSHGARDGFLKAFLETVGLPHSYLNSNRCSQNNTERVIGLTPNDEKGRIDIIIEDGNHAVIIENKIYAKDEKNQLLRYYNYGKTHFPRGFKLLYLTLDGRVASDYSLGNKYLDYQIVSYEHDICEWLEMCYEFADNRPLVQTVIKQYNELIKQLTHTDMDTKYREQLKSLILKPENIMPVCEILKLQEEWFDEISNEYIWKPLEAYAKSNGLKFDKETDYGHESGAWVYKDEWQYYGLFVWTGRKFDWNKMFIGISWHQEPNRKMKICKKDYYQLDCLREAPTNGWPYGWEYLPDNIRNWNYFITEEIVEGKVFKFIKNKFEEILLEITQKELPMP